ANGDTKSVSAKHDGSYVIRNLLPGSYEITVSARGFADIHTTVTLGADGNPVMNLVMQPVTPRVAGEKQVGSTARGATNPNGGSDLPMNGRSASDVAGLAPGVPSAGAQE